MVSLVFQVPLCPSSHHHCRPRVQDASRSWSYYIGILDSRREENKDFSASSSFFFKDFFNMDFFKSLYWTCYELFPFYDLVSWLWDMWDLSFLTRDWPHTPSLEGEVLTTGLPGKSLCLLLRRLLGSLTQCFHLQPLTRRVATFSR